MMTRLFTLPGFPQPALLPLPVRLNHGFPQAGRFALIAAARAAQQAAALATRRCELLCCGGCTGGR
ncbi:hypothetical protein KCP69_10665 [Salmonella enterica subsp. enterica]|nr:hypothetical protein KCP69_10665 [Salmonella enterica subsp. enterica]